MAYSDFVRFVVLFSVFRYPAHSDLCRAYAMRCALCLFSHDFLSELEPLIWLPSISGGVCNGLLFENWGVRCVCRQSSVRVGMYGMRYALCHGVSAAAAANCTEGEGRPNL